MASLLTSDDLDGLGTEAVRARDPRPYAEELVSAVEEGRLADPEDAAYALSLAAEARELAGDHDEAVDLSARAVGAGAGSADRDWIPAAHAERLLRLGRGEEGMAELTKLRPLLLREVGSVRPIADALTENGRGEIAEQWLTAAVLTAIERVERLPEGSEEHLDAEDLVDELIGRRRDVRADLGLAADEYDAMADDLDAAPDLVFHPEPSFTRLLAAHPAAADELGHDWDTHRALVERELQAADAEGEPLEVEVATPELLAAMLADLAAGPPAPDPAPGPRLVWPPGRNDPCWCGSRTKYKKCCLPRGRASDARPVPPPVPAPAPAPATSPSPGTSPGTSPSPSERVIGRGTGGRPRVR
ncbi:SEC-C domain-containing protein [Actinomycetospora lutea]|uniref:SEC-C domain-containing protein n=1 Tax=Actinomycetospora lutea TaxID=663604 RepID=UPI002365F004|nr:SEC-C domain-containing protein [Actinomycetospora lutea]MDD7937628.1 SEC-C domain-containing protein [Actinomycetospora lutea]